MITLFFLCCFSVGEKLEYAAKFSFLQLGTMTLEVKDTITYRDIDCYVLSSIVTSNPSLRFLFSIHDTVEVYARTHDLLPFFYEEKINEGTYHNHAILHFNQEDLSVTYGDSSAFDIVEDTRDVLTFWYYLRTIPLPVGDTIVLNIHKSKENYEVNCYIQKKEVVKTAAGEFRTLVVSARTDKPGIFGPHGGMEIWYSDDKRRYPVQIRAAMKIGSILFKLQEVHQLENLQ